MSGPERDGEEQGRRRLRMVRTQLESRDIIDRRVLGTRRILLRGSRGALRTGDGAVVLSEGGGCQRQGNQNE